MIEVFKSFQVQLSTRCFTFVLKSSLNVLIVKLTASWWAILALIFLQRVIPRSVPGHHLFLIHTQAVFAQILWFGPILKRIFLILQLFKPIIANTFDLFNLLFVEISILWFNWSVCFWSRNRFCITTWTFFLRWFQSILVYTKLMCSRSRIVWFAIRPNFILVLFFIGVVLDLLLQSFVSLLEITVEMVNFLDKFQIKVLQIIMQLWYIILKLWTFLCHISNWSTIWI